MVARALKHFVVVGLVFALGVGWALTFAVNNFLGLALDAALGNPKNEPYWMALVLTLTSWVLITASTVVGNRVFRRRMARSGIATRELSASTTLFFGLVMVFVWPDLADLMNRFMTHMSYTYEHQGEAWLMLSLPLFRMISGPIMYFLVSRAMLPSPGTAEVRRAA